MNSISKGHKLLGGLLFAICLLVSSSVGAHGWGGHGGWGHGGWGRGGGFGFFIGPGLGYYGNPYYYSNCGWVGGHWARGYWVPAHRVCWY